MGLARILAEEGIIPWSWGAKRASPNSCEWAWQCISHKLKNMKEKDLCIASILSVALLLWYVGSRFDDDDDADSDFDDENPDSGGQRPSNSLPNSIRPIIEDNKDSIDNIIEDNIDSNDLGLDGSKPDDGNEDQDGIVKPVDDEGCPPSIVSSEKTPSEDETGDGSDSQDSNIMRLHSESLDTFKEKSGLSHFKAGDSRQKPRKNSKDDSDIVDKAVNNKFYSSSDDHLYNAQVVARNGATFGHRKPPFNLKTERLSAIRSSKFNHKNALGQEIMKKTVCADDCDNISLEGSKSKFKKISPKSGGSSSAKKVFGNNNYRGEF